MFKRCGFIILFSLAFIFKVYAEELDLEKIVVSKESIHLARGYALRSQQLEDLPFDSPIEALASLPMDLQSRSPKGAIQTDFSLRGSSFQGVLVLFQGQRINDPQTAHHNADIPITKEDVQRVEVLPGVSSAIFGPDSIGGVVNFILKKPEKRNIVLQSSGGQFKTWSGLFSATERLGSLGARLSVENQESAGFYTDTDFKKLTTSLNSVLELPDGEYNLSFGYQEKEFGAYDFYTPGMGYQSKEWTKTYLLNTGLSLGKSDLLIKPNLLWRRHYDKFMLDKTLVRSRYLNHTRTDMLTPNIYLQKEFSSIGRLGLGIEYGQETMNSVFLGKHDRTHKSIFLDESKEFNDRLSLGLSFRADDYSDTDTAFTGSLSAKFKLSDIHGLRFGVSRSTRVPSFTELYYSDPTTVGNPGLADEISLNHQIGYDYKKDSISFSSTVFCRQEEDLIDWVKSSPSQARWQAQNIGEDKVFGIENQLKVDINELFSLESNYTFIDRYSNNQGYLYKYGPNYARHLANSELLIKLPFGTQSVGFTYKKKPVRDGWFLLNAHLSYNLNKYSSLFLNATNLCNVEYQEIEGIPSPGRWVEGGFRLEW
jgi:iron complex outermembrane receptor protein